LPKLLKLQTSLKSFGTWKACLSSFERIERKPLKLRKTLRNLKSLEALKGLRF